MSAKPKTEPVVDVEPVQEDNRRYVVLKEQTDDSDNTMYNFIRFDGNEKALERLHKDLERVECWDWDYTNCAFELDIEHPVCEQTAREMCVITVNEYYSRKFDGVLTPINFGFNESDSQKKVLKKITKCLYDGMIERHVTNEDMFGRGAESSESESSSEEEKVVKHRPKKVNKLPPDMEKRREKLKNKKE